MRPTNHLPVAHRHSGWNALHYAVASHKVQLVQQLLAAGAEIEAPDPLLQLTPLHLACMGKIKDQQQLEQLKQAAGTLYEFQVGVGVRLTPEATVVHPWSQMSNMAA